MIEKSPKIYSKQDVEKATLNYFKNDSLATDVWIKKYCLKDEKNYYELTPDDMHRRIAKELARIEAKYPNPISEEQIYETLKEFKRIVPQGSPMSGIGNDFQIVSLGNCFVIGNKGNGDSYGGILKIDQEQVQLMKRRGGVGHDLSHIRPNGSPVKNSAITSTGIVPFMERYSNSTKEVAQDGRRGALMLSVSIKHPDVEKFIDAKLTQGKITGANISVKIDDDFMNAVVENNTYTQKYPIHSTEPKYTKDIDAPKLWKKIIFNAWKSAEPGILFWDKIIGESIPSCYGKEWVETSTNPCFSGKEMLLTTLGNKTFEELCDLENINIINCIGNIVPTKVFHSGKKETIQLHDTQGNIIICTPNQIWKNIKGQDIEAKKIKGEKLLPFLYCNYIHDELYVKLGFIQGDGNLSRLKSESHKGFEVNIGINDNDVLNYFGLKRETDKQRKFYVNDYVEICKQLNFSDKQLPERNLPTTINDWDKHKQLSFLSGLFSANGSVVGNYRISFKTTNKILVIELQNLLKIFNIDSYYTTNKSKLVSFENGDYVCKESYDLNIGKYYDLIKFYTKIGFIHKYKNDKLFNVIISRSPKITKIVNNGIIDVYDFIEPETNWGIVNGCVSHNCGELPLPPYDSCRLLCVNLYGYVLNPFTKDAKFDWDAFKNDVVISMRYMDDIIDLELEKIDKILAKIQSDPEDELIKLYEINLWNQIKKMAIKGRRTGLGVTAEGDMIAAMGLRYGTDEATDFSEEVHKTLKLSAYRSSVIMAKERGAFPIYDWDKEKENPFIERIFIEDEELYRDMVKFGRRNIALLTIAPTGTASLMTQTTSGIEPVFLPVYMRRRKINPQEKDIRIDFVDDEGIAWMEYPVFHHKFETWLEINGYDVNVVKSMNKEQVDEIVKKSPYYKATSNDVDWVKKVEMQGRIQKHVDHSISVTVNLPEDVSEEIVAKVYETGWRSGCKGITVYRDKSRSGVLISDNNKKTDELLHDNHAPKRPKRLKGEIHRFQNNLEKWIAVVGMLDGRPFELFTGLYMNGLTNLPVNIKDCEIVKNIVETDELNEKGEKIKKKRYDIEYIDNNGIKQIHTGLNHAFNPEYWNYAKLTSGILRHGMPIIKVYELIESLNFREESINTWKNGVIRVIKKYIKDGEKGRGKCQECGSENFVFKEGCLMCINCGWSKCS
jgi:ribonucleotide reductase alpha subunit